MPDSTHQSDQIMADAGRSLQVQRAGGRRAGSIGRGSAELKTRHLLRKVKRIVIAVAGIVVAAMVAGLIVDGIGFTGVMLAFFAIVAVTVGFSIFPKMKVPQRAELNKGSVQQLVGRTELWLEAQRNALPAPAARVLDDIGVQLDALGLQLEGVDQNHEAAREVRKLVGEYLPETIDSYRKIPAHLRTEQRTGGTPDQQVTESLKKISAEIDSVTRQLAQGSLDELAIRTRYLDYKYGHGTDEGSGVPLPDFEAEKAARTKS
jgi:hypothetical protein